MNMIFIVMLVFVVDHCIRLYDTKSSKTFNLLGGVAADSVGWSILDTALSPDRSSVAYSTWSDERSFLYFAHIFIRDDLFVLLVYLIKFDETFQQSKIFQLRLEPEAHSFCIFSLQFSDDGTEIIGGSNDNSVYVYDLTKQKRTLRVMNSFSLIFQQNFQFEFE